LYEEKSDHIVGVLFAKDILRFARDARVTLRDIMHGARFVPEGKRIRDLFGELIAAHEHQVIVVDEHGSFAGIVTLEDILEEIFGEIRDRREKDVEDFLRIDDRSVVVDGAMELERFNEVLEARLDSDEVETIAGYLTERIGWIPREGEAFTVEGMRFLVISAGSRRIHKIRIERTDREGGSV
jgi:magnesium and cobalt transporter